MMFIILAKNIKYPQVPIVPELNLMTVLSILCLGSKDRTQVVSLATTFVQFLLIIFCSLVLVLRNIHVYECVPRESERSYK